jgi:hypothetical protein
MGCGRTGRPIGRASAQKQPTDRPRLAAGAQVNLQFGMMDAFYKIRVTKSTKIRTPRLIDELLSCPGYPGTERATQASHTRPAAKFIIPPWSSS